MSVTPQCRWGPVTRPVAPTLPIGSPADTAWPASTSIADRWQYIVTSPWPWSIRIVLPLKKYSPVSSTTPSAGAMIGVPVGAAMSMPVCGLRGSPLKKRRRPYELERGPGTGWRSASVAGGSGDQVASAARMRSRSALVRARSSFDRLTWLGFTTRRWVEYCLAAMSRPMARTLLSRSVTLSSTLAGAACDSGTPTTAVHRPACGTTMVRTPSSVATGAIVCSASSGPMSTSSTPPGTALARGSAGSGPLPAAAAGTISARARQASRVRIRGCIIPPSRGSGIRPTPLVSRPYRRPKVSQRP